MKIDKITKIELSDKERDILIMAIAFLFKLEGTLNHEGLDICYCKDDKKPWVDIDEIISMRTNLGILTTIDELG